MGGIGSGRSGGRRCTDDLRALDIRLVHRQGCLRPGFWFNWNWSRRGNVVASVGWIAETDRIVMRYQNQNPRYNGGEWEQMSYAVQLEWTACRYGGRRPWWRCPALECGRRVAVLYGGRIFACRHCHDLAYRSSRENLEDRAARRAGKIRSIMGWTPGILNGEEGKPKGMHWRRYSRLVLAHDEEVDQVLGWFAKRFKLQMP